MSSPSCPTGYFPIPGDSSNCVNSTNTTTVQKVCPAGQTLQTNGLCGTGPTVIQTAATYCGPQYSGKNCSLRAQVTTALTPATGSESIPNTICAFVDNGTQVACDPGCCTEAPTSTSSTEESTSSDGKALGIVIGSIFGGLLLIALIAFLYRKYKMSSNSNGIQ